MEPEARARHIIIAVSVVIIFAILFIKLDKTFLNLSGNVISEECTDCLSVYNWEEYISPEVIAEFEKGYNTKVNLVEFKTMEDLVTAFEANPSAADVLIVDNTALFKLTSENLISHLDHSKITNIDNINLEFMKVCADSDNNFSMPYLWGTVGIAYNKKIVTDNVDSWSIFWNKDYAGRMSLLDESRAACAAVLQKIGFSANTNDDVTLLQAKTELEKTNVMILSSLDTMSALVNKEVVVAELYNGDAYATMLANPDIVYIIPKEGGLFWIDRMVLSKASDKQDRGYKFIDFLLQPNISAQNANYNKYASPLDYDKVAPFIDPVLAKNEIIYPPDSSFANLECIKPILDEHMHEDILSSYKKNHAQGVLITSTVHRISK
jgi:spermidine/putrescine transport system substrate-binding protein